MASPASANGVSGLSSRLMSRHAAVIGMISSCRRRAAGPNSDRRPIRTTRGDELGPTIAVIAADGGAKALTDETRNQALDQPVFQMELDDILRLRLDLPRLSAARRRGRARESRVAIARDLSRLAGRPGRSSSNSEAQLGSLAKLGVSGSSSTASGTLKRPG